MTAWEARLHPPLILTRPEAQARRFALEVRALGVRGPILFSPVMEIAPMGGGGLPTGPLAFTSENGAVMAARRGDLRGREVFAVGGRTAAVAAGFGARVLSAEGDVAALGDLILSEGPDGVTHLHGEHVSGDLVGRLRAAGIAAGGIVIYRQSARPLTMAARSALGGAAVLALFSPRTARIVAGDLPGTTDGLALAAMSARVAEAWPLGGTVTVAHQPTAAEMAKVVAALVGGHG